MVWRNYLITDYNLSGHIVGISDKITMNKRTKSNSIRIIAGQWRGRKLSVLDADGLRPTTDRVRETLFNWLMYDVQGARCLDLYAGTGVLGLEALSRGAQFVQFIESQKPTANAIGQNLQVLNVTTEQSAVVYTSAQQFLLNTPDQPYDLVFLDPPFGKGLLVEAIQVLSQEGWLNERAFVYIEQGAKEEIVEVPDNWQLYRQGKAGQSCFRLYSLHTI